MCMCMKFLSSLSTSCSVLICSIYLYSIDQLVWYCMVWIVTHYTTAAIVVLYTSLVPCMCNIVYDSVEGLLTVNFQCKYSGLS